MTLSHDIKESIKTALAMTIVYGVGLHMGWDRPYWAGFAVAFISLATVGQSFNKGALRMMGTVMGVLAALTLVALFAQQRWLFILFTSLWVGLCTYMMAGSRHQ
ncbi:MAG: FUSC family protein, partial [Gammaproteobacteria bacterium]